MATYGKIGEFRESEETLTQYVERLEQYFLTNEVEDAAKQRAILLSVCGSKTYAQKDSKRTRKTLLTEAQ